MRDFLWELEATLSGRRGLFWAFIYWIVTLVSLFALMVFLVVVAITAGATAGHAVTK